MTLKWVDENLTCPMFGHKTVQEYFTKSGTAKKIPLIKIPTLFMFSRDDPIIDMDYQVDYQMFSKNPYTAVASTQHGGHMGYHQSIFCMQFWLASPVIAYFNGIK